MAEIAEVAVTKVETSKTVVAGGITQRASAMVTRARVKWDQIPETKRPWMTAGVAMIVAVIAGMLWYSSRPDWKVLFSGLESRDSQQVAQELGAAGIPFQMTGDGAGIEVPAESLDKARMEVAAKGMPQTGRLGFELFDKPNWVGSEFDEHVNYQRSLEGELEHTIGTLGVVKSARVHLALPQESLFAQEQKGAKASVVLRLKRSALATEQADSIRNLVAGAVENLSPDQVTLVDADGRVNLQKKSHSAEQEDAEQALEAKLVAMLEPLAGAGNVRASVNMAYDEQSEERTDEVYDPTLTATLSVQKSERTNGITDRPSGVPGTASNSPAASAPGAVAGSTAAASPGTPPLLQKGLPVYPQAGGQMQSEKQETGTYAVTRHLSHTEAAPGRLRRVMAAVVVNDRQAVDPGTKLAVWKPRSVDEMHRLEELAQAAVGFESKRGDQVVLENVSFSSNAPEVKLPLMDRVVEEVKNVLHSQPGLYRLGMMGLLGLLLVFFVLRPLAGQVVETLKEPQALAAGEVRGELGAGEIVTSEVPASAASAEEWFEGAEASPSPVRRRPRIQPRDPVYQDVLEHIQREPAQSIRLLETWIGEVEEDS